MALNDGGTSNPRIDENAPASRVEQRKTNRTVTTVNEGETNPSDSSSDPSDDMYSIRRCLFCLAGCGLLTAFLILIAIVALSLYWHFRPIPTTPVDGTKPGPKPVDSGVHLSDVIPKPDSPTMDPTRDPTADPTREPDEKPGPEPDGKPPIGQRGGRTGHDKPMFEEYKQRASLFTDALKLPFPTEKNSIFTGGFDWNEVVDDMKGTYRVCHGSALVLGHRFLRMKREFGSEIEQNFYKDMTLTKFFDRLSTKRAVVLHEREDEYRLRNGKRGGWEAVGKEEFGAPLLADYLSYGMSLNLYSHSLCSQRDSECFHSFHDLIATTTDEILLSALTGVSSPSHFINNGKKDNKGEVNAANDHQPRGIQYGAVGPRFQRNKVMEQSLMKLDYYQNHLIRGYGDYNDRDKASALVKAMDDNYFWMQLWKSQERSAGVKPPIFTLMELFYGMDYFPLFSQVAKFEIVEGALRSELKRTEGNKDTVFYVNKDTQTGYIRKGKGEKSQLLNVNMWRIRIQITLESFLFDSDRRAGDQKKKAFCHLVQLGGQFEKVWQNREMVKIVESIVEEMSFENIHTIYFANMDGIEEDKRAVKSKSGKMINFEVGKRNPADKLVGECAHCLLVAMIDADGASFPGNAYWLGNLDESSDSSAASSSTIPYIQNPEINTEYLNGENTRFYFVNEDGKYEFVTLSHIQKEIDEGKEKEWLAKSAKSIPDRRKLMEEPIASGDDVQITKYYEPTKEHYQMRTDEFVKNLGYELRFPTQTNNIFDKKEKEWDQVVDDMKNTYRLCHGSALVLGHRFLMMKREYGSEIEKKFFKDVKLTQLFDRISRKRPVVFLGPGDFLRLRNGGTGGWVAVGKDVEADGPFLADYMSYDEMMLSALTAVSSPTHFINDCGRFSKGEEDPSIPFERRGIMYAAVGARFERPHVMENALMLIDEGQNKKDKGYGKYQDGDTVGALVKASDDDYFVRRLQKSKELSPGKPAMFTLYELFYGVDYLPTFAEAELFEKMKDPVEGTDGGPKTYQVEDQSTGTRYVHSIPKKKYINMDMYRASLRMRYELFLSDSNRRAELAGTQAWVNLLGLGVGVWGIDGLAQWQDFEHLKIVTSIVKEMPLKHIHTIWFNFFGWEFRKYEGGKEWFKEFYEYELTEVCLGPGNNPKNILKAKPTHHDTHQNPAGHEINFRFGYRNPTVPLGTDCEGCLLTNMFAWDGASFLGNEYWEGYLDDSGDPAAACCSTIPYLHNPEINKEYLNGPNTRFYFVNEKGEYEFATLSDIQKDFDAGEGKKWLEKSAKSIPYLRDVIKNEG